VLAAAARAKSGLSTFARNDEIDRFLQRARFVRERCPELELPPIDGTFLDAALARLCEGRTRFAELRDADPHGAVLSALTREQARAVAEHAPERVTLPGGRQVRVEYDDPAAPWIASRLQDFFGLAEGPRLAKGRVPVVLHLLAPNQRAVQVTTDLAGFWTRHYPAIAKELRRKYPKHAWPDDPRTAKPPQAGGPRR
jgi:ATP-dependent helicase HrpB